MMKLLRKKPPHTHAYQSQVLQHVARNTHGAKHGTPKKGGSPYAVIMHASIIAWIVLFGLNNYASRRFPVNPPEDHPDYPIENFSQLSYVAGSTKSTVQLAICAIVKDEAPYLAEWIEHHRSVGFDTILLYNDRSTDDTQCVLDAYAQQGYVTRVPEDIGENYMEDLPWKHNSLIPNNPQQAIFEACRRYLVNEEVSSGKVGSTWMLTNDVDEFVWFDQKFGDAKNSLLAMLSDVSSRSPWVRSVVIPNCLFGPSGKESFERGSVMRRFVYRDNNLYCKGKDGGTWAMGGKAFSHVSSIARGQLLTPHNHRVAKSSTSPWSKHLQKTTFRFDDVYSVQAYMRLAHYKTKSREEFYSRVCNSRYYSTYYNTSYYVQTKNKYPGCCSPSSFFDFMGDAFVHEDNMMLPFADELERKLSNTASACKTMLERTPCPNSVMEAKNWKGLKKMEMLLADLSSPNAEKQHLDNSASTAVSASAIGMRTDTVFNLAICAIVKDEAPYLAEWIEHHRSVGFDTILLYNDRSTDDTQCVLDAYAQQGYVTRVPEDIGEKYMEGLRWEHEGQITNNPQQAIFEACRRYLADEENSSGKAGSTWMLTNDVDEFVWFDRKFGNAKSSLLAMLLESSSKETSESFIIPKCLYGHSRKEVFEPEIVMKRFVHRDENSNCAPKGWNPWAAPGKAFSRVSSIASFTRPELHKVQGHLIDDAGMVGDFMKLAHYGTKSRDEFYSRVCGSRYAFKYYTSPKIISPEQFIDSFNDEFVHEDNMMLPFAEELERKMLNPAAAICNVEYRSLHCPSFLMEGKREDGFMRLVHWKLQQSPLKPIIFGAGFGTTATHTMFDATCNLRLRSLHYLQHCGYGNDPKIPLPGLLAHISVVRAYKVLSQCITSLKWGAVDNCPSVNQTLNVMLMHIDKVLQSNDVDAIHDTPYPEFADYVLDAAERIRGVKPIVLLSERNPADWARRRMHEHTEDLVCQLHATDSKGRDQRIGQNMYLCLQTAIQNGLGDKSVAEIFRVMNQLNPASSELLDQLNGGVQMYQDQMRDKSNYIVNLFERSPRVSSDKLAAEIDASLTRLQHPIPKSDDFLPPSSHAFPNIGKIRKRDCMPSFGQAFASGRHCNKLVVFLHFHRAGGTSIIDYMRSPALWYNLHTDSDPETFSELQPPNGTIISEYGNLRIHSSANIDSKFWSSLYDRGVDFVNLEHNFVTPEVYADMPSSAYMITQLRSPWDRFRSTYERELQVQCSHKWGESIEKSCLRNNSLEKWMLNRTGVMPAEREGKWGSILYPNYYVRVLNGINDSPFDTLLTRDHLETAKRVLDSFESVLILEDDEQVNLQKIWGLLGDFRKVGKKAGERLAKMPKLNNNGLKQNPSYEALRKEIDVMQPLFNDLNTLDLELYEYARRIKMNNFDLQTKNGDQVECRIEITQHSQRHLMRPLPPPPQQRGDSNQQFMIHIHGWPHTGTGYLRKIIHDSLNKLNPESSSVQDSTLGGGRYYIEDEGQYLQNVYPKFEARMDSKIDFRKKYGMLMYLADTCTFNSTSTTGDQSNPVGKLLFNQWSGYWENTSATFLIQKTPTLDVLFHERVKVLPTLHLIIVRHPMAFRYIHKDPRRKARNWRPLNWLESWTHVFSALSEGTVEWYAVVSYEALVEHHDQVVQELMEVIRSGTSRLGHDRVFNNDGPDASKAGWDTSKTTSDLGTTSHRRLELRTSGSPTSHLDLSEEVTDQWNKCLKQRGCNATLNSVSSEILPSLGYRQRDREGGQLTSLPGTVTVSREFGHVLFSSEGGALQGYRRTQQGFAPDDDLGNPPSPELVAKMERLLGREVALQEKWRG